MILDSHELEPVRRGVRVGSSSERMCCGGGFAVDDLIQKEARVMAQVVNSVAGRNEVGRADTARVPKEWRVH